MGRRRRLNMSNLKKYWWLGGVILFVILISAVTSWIGKEEPVKPRVIMQVPASATINNDPNDPESIQIPALEPRITPIKETSEPAATVANIEKEETADVEYEPPVRGPLNQ